MKILNKYSTVIIVGAFFALTCVYNTFGVNYSVFWNTFIKTVRELFVLALLFKLIPYQKNALSVLFLLGAVSMSLGYMIFRFNAAFMAADFNDYIELMKSTTNRLIMSVFIFCILVSIKFIKSRNSV